MTRRARRLLGLSRARMRGGWVHDIYFVGASARQILDNRIGV